MFRVDVAVCREFSTRDKTREVLGRRDRSGFSASRNGSCTSNMVGLPTPGWSAHQVPDFLLCRPGHGYRRLARHHSRMEGNLKMDFLLEIGLEEIPARMIDTAREELARRVTDLLGRERLSNGSTKLTAYSTPRRLAVLAQGIATSQSDSTEQVTGPALKIAYKDGAPTPAAEAFAKK